MQREDKESLQEAVDRAFLQETAEDLYENAPCGYISSLPDGTIVRVNQTFLHWTGYKRDELIGRKRFSDLLTIGGRMYYETHYAPLLQMQGSVREIAVDLVGTEGKTMPVLLSATVRQNGSENPALVRTTIFSARDRRQYERELLRERQRAEDSEGRARLLAQTLQKSFIPPAPPQIPGLDIGGAYRPAGRGDEVGGDFYDVFETSGGDWAVIIGDVSGKGAEAAGVTALARYTLRATAMRSKRPRVVLDVLNRALLQQKAARFCTAVYCRVHRTAGDRFQISFSVAGHPLPLLMKGGAEPAYSGHHGTLLGSFEDPDLQDQTVEMAPGDAFLLYTDGVTEGRRGDEFFGEERLSELLASLGGATADGIASAIAAQVIDFQEGLPRDDLAIVALKVP